MRKNKEKWLQAAIFLIFWITVLKITVSEVLIDSEKKVVYTLSYKP